MKHDAILRIISAKRRLHPELRTPLTWPGLKRLLRRIGLDIEIVPLARPAQLIGFEGKWTIMLSNDMPSARYLHWAAHELGHYWLHVEPNPDAYEPCYQMREEWADDEGEDDAECFAQAVLGGMGELDAEYSPQGVELISQVLRATTRRELDRLEDLFNRDNPIGVDPALVRDLINVRRKVVKEKAIDLVRQFATEVKEIKNAR